MAKNFRTLYRWMLPGYYHAKDTDGEKVLHSLALIKDAFLQMAKERMTARFPSYAGESALALIGADRGIPRGRSEEKEHYAARLIAWRFPRGHRVRGNSFALLEQIWEYFGGGFEIRSEQQNSLRFVRDEDGVETATVGLAWNWDSPDNPDADEQWARFWLVLEASSFADPTADLGDPALWGGDFGDSSNAVGHVGISAEDVVAIRKLFRGRPWKPGGTRAMWAVISLDGSFPVPDGTWGPWAKDDGTGNYVAARPSTFRYWALDEASLQYAGDPSAYPESSDSVDGGTYDGDPTSFPASADLPTTAAYAGNPASFPSSARLVDDGSIP